MKWETDMVKWVWSFSTWSCRVKMSAKGKGKVSGSVEDSQKEKGAINDITRVQIDGVVSCHL